MPKIFSEAQRQHLYEQLKHHCITLMKERGGRGFQIRELTARCGISPGTFYHFYPSKEDLLFQIIKDNEAALTGRFMEIAETRKITRTDFLQLYFTFFMRDESNILRYLTRSDLTALALHGNHPTPLETLPASMAAMTSYLRHPKAEINFNAVINFIQVINFCLENQDYLIKDEWEATIWKLLNNIADEIFAED